MTNAKKTIWLGVSMSLILPISAVGAGLDRSGQSVAAFLQNNNYFEAGYTFVVPDVSGEGKNRFDGYKVSDMADSYHYGNLGLKFQPTEQISVGLLYDVPFGANGTYATDDAVLSSGMGMYSEQGESTQATAKAENFSVLVGYQPNKNLNFYTGIAYQTFEAEVQARGAAFSGKEALGQYNVNMDKDDAMGWLVGLSYQVPEKMFKASITYRSEIDHKLQSREFGQSNIMSKASGNANDAFFDEDTVTPITTPKSVNIDLQGLVYKNIMGFANIRWVDWSSFSIRPEYFYEIAQVIGANGLTPSNPNGFDLIAYQDDQISATVGLGKKLSEKWMGNISLGWDSGTGNPSSTLGPTKGNWSYGVGLQFSPTKEYFVAGGVKYIQIGDAKAQTASTFGTKDYIAEFEDNNGWGYGLKFGYRF